MSLSGVLSGTPTTADTFTVDVIVHTGPGDYDYVGETLTLVINPAPLPPQGPGEAGRLGPGLTICPTQAPA